VSYRLHRVAPADWSHLRELRLQALRDTPIAFLETHEQALAVSENEWRFRAARSAGFGSVQTVAIDGEGRWVGTMGSYLDEEDARTAWLVGVFVAPEHRGPGGPSRELLAEVVRWAGRQGAERLVLEVHESNGRAIGFYRRFGFTETGETTRYPLEPGGLELVMTLPL
jgi:ribosomal protein S18 acetylase RimI-like enzyme